MIQPIANENQTEALELMKHPRSVVTFSDPGAHVSQIMDSSLQTHLLSHWVREKQAFHARGGGEDDHLRQRHPVRLPRSRPAARGHGGRHRGVRSRHDRRACPRSSTICRAGAKRFRQKCDGMHATIVNGQVLLRDNEPTGNLPGRLIRNKRAMI